MRHLWATAICPASCGEILQGSIGDCNFLVTCPIALYTKVSVHLGYNMATNSEHNKSQYKKALQAVDKTLKYFGKNHLKPLVTVNSSIPRGIGLASSTADISAACLATAQALGKRISNDTIADIALSIEPSDGIMYPGAVLFDHISGRLRKRLGPLPEMDVYIIDIGQQVNTERFNSIKDLKGKNKQKEQAVKHALRLTLEAFEKADIKLLGDAMKISAVAHQSILFKPHLKGIIDIGSRYNAVGVNVAHSGSIIGVFFRKGQTPPERFWKEVRNIMQNFNMPYDVIKTCTDNNGPRILKFYNNNCQER
jgi:L-threonine kinase